MWFGPTDFLHNTVSVSKINWKRIVTIIAYFDIQETIYYNFLRVKNMYNAKTIFQTGTIDDTTNIILNIK